MTAVFNITDFFVLRSQADELAYALKKIQHDEVELPDMAVVALNENETVNVSDALSAVLQGLNKATSVLAADGMAFAGDPIDMQLNAELIEFDNTNGQVLVQINPKG